MRKSCVSRGIHTRDNVTTIDFGSEAPVSGVMRKTACRCSISKENYTMIPLALARKTRGTGAYIDTEALQAR